MSETQGDPAATAEAPAHHDAGVPKPPGGRDWREVTTVLVLAATAVLTAWCGFQSSKWGGAMAISFSQASSARIQAADAMSQSRDARGVDLAVYTQYVEAVATEQPRLAEYVEERFSPELTVAFDDWEAHGQTLPSPFNEPSYEPPGQAEADELNSRADAKFQEALDHNQQGDDYSILTVLFALVLFFAAMSGRDFPRWAGLTFLGVAALVGATGVAILTRYPILL
jgi:hypothetical protein